MADKGMFEFLLYISNSALGILKKLDKMFKVCFFYDSYQKVHLSFWYLDNKILQDKTVYYYNFIKIMIPRKKLSVIE